jgi:hypothetical protein
MCFACVIGISLLLQWDLVFGLFVWFMCLHKTGFGVRMGLAEFG